MNRVINNPYEVMRGALAGAPAADHDRSLRRADAGRCSVSPAVALRPIGDALPGDVTEPNAARGHASRRPRRSRGWPDADDASTSIAPLLSDRLATRLAA